MLGFSREFLNKSRVTKIWLNFTLSDGTLLEYHEDRVLFNGFVRDTSTTVDGEFTVGAAVTGKLSLHLDNSDDALSAYDFRGATVVAWLGGYKPSPITSGLHPDASVTEENQFTITGLTQEQLALFEVGGHVAFGMEDGDQDVGVATITAVSTSGNVTTITVEDEISISNVVYVSILVGEKINAGRYYVDEYTYDGSNVSMVAYDDMVKFDIPCKGNLGWISQSNIRTLYMLALRSCTAAGISLHPSITSGFFNRRIAAAAQGFSLSEKEPPQWKTSTLHDVISAIAQVTCTYARIVYVPNPGDYRLFFGWYDTSQLTSNQYDGGTFDTDSTPYSDGATLDGGSFDPWSTGDVADGGTFGDRAGVHIVESPYDLTVDTDDVQITGASVTLEPSDNVNADDNTSAYTKTLGTAGYIIQISGNLLVTTEDIADKICSVLYYYLNGMRFRPLNAACVEDPSMEAGDVAIVTGRNNNTYSCFLSRVTFSVNASTQISCDAASTMQNLKGRFSGAQKTQAMIQRVAEDRAASSAETAMLGILASYTSARGLYQHAETDESGATIYTYGNAATLADSNIRWRFSAGSLMVSTDYGATWNGALSADGTAVMQQLYAIGINADYIEAGTITVGGTSKGLGSILVKNQTNAVTITMDTNGLYHGKTGPADYANTGFYLNDDGFIIGNADDNLYFQALPSGEIVIHDNPALIPGAVATTFSITSGYGTTNLGSAYSVFGGDVDINGDLDVNGTIINNSDRRLKDHKSYLNEDAIEFIRKLKPVHYIKYGKNEVGFYAQDVAEIDPWECMTSKKGEYMGLNYIEIIAPLVAYCQSLEKRIEELEGR